MICAEPRIFSQELGLHCSLLIQALPLEQQHLWQLPQKSCEVQLHIHSPSAVIRQMIQERRSHEEMQEQALNCCQARLTQLFSFNGKKSLSLGKEELDKSNT
ncbi:hypothetical protein SLA2020_503530 [Shorea laevis]